MPTKFVQLCLLFCVFFSCLKAQNKEPYTYQQLSHIFYAKQIDSIKKNWNCPFVFKVKETQKKYKEFWEARTEFITNALNSKDYVCDKEVYNYLDQLLLDLTKGNPTLIPQKPFLLIDRSSAVNAYTIGGNIIAVNAGLITFAQKREELALVLAHELAHNILNHADNSMRERAVWLSSDEYKSSLNAILDSKYERLTRLKKVLEVYSFNRSRHNRYHESEADSLAIVLLKNSNISFNATYFLRLDSADIQYKQPLKNPVLNYFTSYNIPFENWWSQKPSKGLSTKKYNFNDNNSIVDSLKTHPECKDRYEKTLAFETPNKKETLIPDNIKESANKILIWNMFDNQNLTACMYRVLLEKDKGNKDEWYDFMIHNIFTGLFYADKQLNRFNAINVKPKEFISKDYYELQTMMEQMPIENLEQCCKLLQSTGFWQNLNSDAKGLKELMITLTFNAESTVKNKTTAVKEYLDNYPSSMYCEFAEHFKK